jgi:hypothetical protein
VAWNETAYSNPEFDALLDQANGIQDADARREIMAQLQQIMQDDAVTLQPYWRSLFRHAARTSSTRTCIRSSRSTSTISASKRDLTTGAGAAVRRRPGPPARAGGHPIHEGPGKEVRQGRSRCGPAQTGIHMGLFILRRFGVMILTALCLTFVVFFLTNLYPNLEKLAKTQGNARMTDAEVASWLDRNGYGGPMIMRYGEWLGVVPGWTRVDPETGVITGRCIDPGHGPRRRAALLRPAAGGPWVFHRLG